MKRAVLVLLVLSGCSSMSVERSFRLADKGLAVGLFSFSSSASAILAELRTGPASAQIRGTIKSLYGATWSAKVLGF